MALPARFPELASLADADNEEQDFFANVAHLQLHRRTRALARLGKVRFLLPASDSASKGRFLGPPDSCTAARSPWRASARCAGWF